MERITSRKNEYIRHLRALGADGSYRMAQGQFLCDGIKTLREALRFGAQIVSVLWKETAQAIEGLNDCEQYVAPGDLYDYACPLANSPGPLFAVAIRGCGKPGSLSHAIVLESVQDPGNVGTVIRTANAFGVDAVILTGSCADLYQPKTVRATMGAIFRQKVLRVEVPLLREFLQDQGLPLYGAALSERSRDLRQQPLTGCAVAVGSEGRGLSEELLALCDEQIIIPMRPDSESLNAAVAASILMWEMTR
ncbi:MAG: RNA methyltransferase [Oscillospiraceae bacterium]|nr:RNA methyltransferase [Oscillospiraceae bacterium]